MQKENEGEREREREKGGESDVVRRQHKAFRSG